MSVHVFDNVSDRVGDWAHHERHRQPSAYVSAAEAERGGGGPPAVRGRPVATSEQCQVFALEQRSSFAWFKERAEAVLDKCSGKVLDGLVGAAPAGVYAAFAERTIGEEDAAIGGQRPARTATSPNDR